MLVIRPAPAANLSVMLSERSAAMLDFERAWWNIDEPRDQVIRARFQCSPEEYHAELTTVLDDPAAMDHDPLVVRRLKRLRLRARKARLDGWRPSGQQRERSDEQRRSGNAPGPAPVAASRASRRARASAAHRWARR